MEEVVFFRKCAQFIGTSEPALRLLISVLLGYPIAFIHRKFLYGRPPNWQHLYFIACGLCICFFNYGWHCIHSFVSIGITYLTLKICGGNLFSLLFVFTYTMAHLLIGYWTTATSTYDIKWTTPQCVLTLRLIGLAFNVYDGQQPMESLSSENKKVAQKTVPSVLEVFAHSYFPASFVVGPQLPIQRYLDFVELKLEKKENPYELPNSITPGLRRLAMGSFYLLVYQFGCRYVYDDYFISVDYKMNPLWKQFLYLGLWSRITLYKYISCWLITEGSCIIIGLTYNGVDENGKAKWDGCSNVKLSLFENCIRMNQYIESFNINTNHWCAQYIYKRLKFLKNKMLSHLGTLFFLAIWHGFHSGYYATFFFEFLVISSEKEIITAIERNEKLTNVLRNPVVSAVTHVFLRIYTFVVMGYAMIPFILLKYEKYFPILLHFYFFLHIICIVIIAGVPFLLKKKRRVDRDSQDSSHGHRNKIQVKMMKGN